MNDAQKVIAQQCIEWSETDALTFPQIIKALIEAGFEGYMVDLRRSVRTHYLPCGESLELPTAPVSACISETFDVDALKGAIKEAQQKVPGYTYKGFCDKVVRAGCAGYMVSFPGRRAVYYGRTGDIHTEYFPQNK